MTVPPFSGPISLIASDRVENTIVYSRRGRKLGSIQNLMVDKRTGKVEYANLTSGGVFGLGRSTRPLPWHVLSYVRDQHGYVIDIDTVGLDMAADDERERALTFGRDHGGSVREFYGFLPQ